MVKTMENQKVFVVKKEDVRFKKYHDFDAEKAKVALIVTDKQNTPMEAGVFKFNVSFDYSIKADEVIFVLRGCLIITHQGKEYKACEGDYMFLRKGTEANWSCSGETQYFYAAYPVYDVK